MVEKIVFTKSKFDFFVHNKLSEFYPNTLPPIPYRLYILLKDVRIYTYTLKDKTISVRKTAEDFKGTANRLPRILDVADNIYYLKPNHKSHW